MKVRLLMVAAAVMLAGCGSGGPCGGTTCTADQRCTPTQVCVTDNPPTVSIDAPTEGAVVTANAVTVTGSAADDVAVSQVSVGVEGGAVVTVPVMNDGTFSKEVVLPAKDSAPVVITVTAIDSKNRTAKATRTLTVDTVAPTCALTGPSVVTEVGDVTLTLTSADGSGQLTNARLSLDDGATFVPATGAAFTWSVPSENGVVHPLVFRVDDAAGHPCEAKLTVTVDNVKPTVAFTAPDAGTLLGPAFFAAGGVLQGTMGDGTRNVKSVVVAFADGGTKPATLGAGTWTVGLTAPAGDDFVVESATVTATDLADNTASATASFTVDVVAPVLTITAPAMNAKLNIASFPAGNDVALASTATDGDPQAPVVQRELDGGTLGAPVVTTSPTDNPTAYAATLRATDRAGNIGRASVAFSVDRVAPTVTSTVPANNSRMFDAGFASADFSEPMTATGSGLVLSPDAGGSWTSTQKWTSGALVNDTVYAATAGTGTDLFGNPIAAAALAFHTEPFRLAPGVALTSGAPNFTKVVAATADHEGVLALLAEDSAGVQHFIRFSPQTGTPIDYTPPFSAPMTALVAWRTISPGLASRRLQGVTINFATPQVLAVIDGVDTPGPPNSTAFIPTPAFVGEGPGLGEYGFIHDGAYERSGRAPIAVNLGAIHSIQPTATRWEIANTDGGSHTQSFGCYPLPNSIPPLDLCEMRPVVDMGIGPTSPAASRSCTIGAYRVASIDLTASVRWQPNCGPTTFHSGPCFADHAFAGSGGEVVADVNNDGTFYAVADATAGVYQMKKLVLTTACTAAAWVNQGQATALASRPKPVVIRGVAGLVYADASGNLKLAVP